MLHRVHVTQDKGDSVFAGFSQPQILKMEIR